MSKPFTPLVDFARTFLIEEYDPATAAYVPVTTGTITCYIADDADAETPADPALTGTAEYIGGNGDAPAGTWFFGLDAALLTFARCDPLFDGTGVAPWFVVSVPNGVRAVEKLSYKRVKKVTAA